MGWKDYILAPWESNDGKLGIRPLMATASLFGMIKYIETHVAPDPAVMYVFVSLIGILLGLSTTQNIAEKAITSKTPNTPPNP